MLTSAGQERLDLAIQETVVFEAILVLWDLKHGKAGTEWENLLYCEYVNATNLLL